MTLQNVIDFDINFYAALFLLVMLVIIYAKKDVYSFSSKMFRYIIISNVILLVFEGVTFIFNEIQTDLAWTINYSFNFIVFLITPLIGCFWASYIDYKIFNSKDRLRKRLYYSQQSG